VASELDAGVPPETLKLKDAVKLQPKVMEAKGKHLRAKYPKRSDLEEAEQLQQDVVAAMESDLGADHPSTLTSQSNLASIYWIQGKFSKAEDIQRVVLRAQIQKLGETHRHTLLSMFNLALTLKQKGEPEVAIQKLEEVVELYNKAYGPEDLESEEMRTTLED
jgi:tetratricopeptide (TPR) repeat protein